MKTDEVINKLAEKFSSDTLGVDLSEGRRGIVSISPSAILNVSEYLYRTEGLRQL